MIYKKKFVFYRNLSVALAVILVLSLIAFALILGSGRREKGPAETDSLSSSSAVSDTVTETVPETKAPTESETADPLESVADMYEGKIEELESLIEKYKDASVDAFGDRADCLSRILELLAVENRPLRTHVDEDGEKTDKRTPADVSFAYLDLLTGAVFSYNADDPRYTASLIKAPYVYAILKDVAEFEYRKLNFAADGSALYASDGSPLFEGEHPNLDADGRIVYLDGEEKYDLSREWSYDSETMFVEGSGKIQDEEDGFALTYLELASYALKYSDNVAFAELRKLFGYDVHYEALASLGIPRHQSFMELSAEELTLCLKAIYEFCEEDNAYAQAMKDAMLTAPYGVMIPAAVSPLPCAHKYGWDVASYHDMAIVYDEHPFALVIMTDLDSGRAEDYGYIQSIVKVILDLHRSFTLQINN